MTEAEARALLGGSQRTQAAPSAGMTEAEATALLMGKQDASSKVFDGADERASETSKLLNTMGIGGQAVAGIGAGLSNTWKNIGDIAANATGLEAIRPDRAKWVEERQLAEPLVDTTAGGVGQVVGEIAATAPLTMGVGGAVRSVGARLLPRALAIAGTQVAPKALATALGLGALTAEGATQGYVLGGPENRGLGSLVGGGTGLGFGVLGRAAGRLGERFAGKAAAAEAKAARQAAKAAAEETASAVSKAGHDAQALYRTLEHIRELQAKGTPEALAELGQLESSGVVREVEQRLFGKSVGKLPGDLAKSEASREAAALARATEAERAAKMAEEALKPSLGKDAWSLFRSYGEPWLGATLGSAVGGPGLGMMGGLIMGRTRMGKALLNRLTKPGNQLAVANALRRGAEGASGALGSDASTALAADVLTPRTVPQELALALAQQEQQDNPTALALRRR